MKTNPNSFCSFPVGLGAGAIAGIAVGIVAVLGLVAGIIYFIGIRNKPPTNKSDTEGIVNEHYEDPQNPIEGGVDNFYNPADAESQPSTPTNADFNSPVYVTSQQNVQPQNKNNMDDPFYSSIDQSSSTQQNLYDNNTIPPSSIQQQPLPQPPQGTDNFASDEDFSNA